MGDWVFWMGGIYVPFFSEGQCEKRSTNICYDTPDNELLLPRCADGGAELGAVPCAVNEC